MNCLDETKCPSLLCVDGYCCDAACDSVCEACNVAGAEGLCTPHAAGADPEGDCVSGACGEGAICAGDVIWGLSFGNANDNVARRVASDSVGNVVIAGSFSNLLSFGGSALNSTGGLDFYVAKLGPDGSHLWSKRFGGVGDEILRGLAIDGGDNVIVAGNFVGNLTVGVTELSAAGSSDMFVAKLDPQGNPIWAKQFGDAESEFLLDVAAHSNGSVAFGCSFFGTIPFVGSSSLVSAGQNDLCLVLLNANGDVLWKKRFGDEEINHLSTFGGLPSALAFDSTGAVFFAGSFGGTIDFGGGPLTSADPSGDMYLAKFAAGGQWAWSKRYGSGNTELMNGIATSPSGKVALVGSFQGTLAVDSAVVTSAGASDVVVVLHDTNGTVSWARRFGDSQPQIAWGVAFEGEDPVVVGSFDSAIDFGAGALSSAGSRDAFVARLDSAGNAVWQRRFGDANADVAEGVVVSDGALVAWGSFDGTIDFGEGALSSAGAADIFVVKMTK